ncbi:ester cyclase [Flavitalea sp. BT771]|uniref:ester cyclase n=1 Tax=Flavitalea sp. BT771 TaxID=3063329 RepID=UPI0026E12754|nr:ester cyclase [Flavitalea sp. BT771]MDO6433680.1 ester cyclase [Flavitalea sp. BT771]MDV6222415.1 ester cyclase [Flavitalea sp. BT771]
MSTVEKNKTVIRRLYDQSLNKRNTALLKELVSEDYVGFQGLKGAAGFEKPIAPLMDAFPDIQWHIQELLGEDDKVVVRWKLKGTQTMEYNGLAPTGKPITNEGMAIFTLKDGKITNGQVLTDRLGFLQELGAVPQDLNQLSNDATLKDQVNLIDKFLVPPAGKAEFYERMHMNRSLLKTLPGFIKDEAYEYNDNDGNLICVTVAHWANREVMAKAREAVQAAYKKEGFDLPAMLKRLNINIDRGIYTTVTD